MSLNYATNRGMVNNQGVVRTWKKMTSFSVIPRTAKTLTNTGVTVAAPVGSPPVNQNCLQFSPNSNFAITGSNADWAATTLEATDGGVNGKLWMRTLGQFTIEFSFRQTTGSFPGQLGLYEMGSNGGMAIGCTPTFIFFAISGSSYYFQVSNTFAVNTWYTIAIQRTGGYLWAYINGVYKGQIADSQDWKPSNTSAVPFWGGGGGSTYLTGQMQEIRISSIARYTTAANYTVSTTPFSNDSYTRLLVHGPAGVVDDAS